MSDEIKKMGANLRRWRIAINTHDVENPTHASWGIGLNIFDIERLGLEIGEEIFPGIVIEDDGHDAGSFRVLCDGVHDGEKAASIADVADRELVHVGGTSVERRELVPAAANQGDPSCT